MAISCLGSLMRFSRDPVQLVLHEDGSLTSDDAEKLSEALPGVQIVYRRSADDMVNERLTHHRNCREYRHQQPYALKLLDIPLLSDGDIAYCDTDVLFFRPFRDLFRLPNDQTSSVFIADAREAYSVLPWHLVGPNKLQLASRVNSGLFLLRKRAYDLDFFEWCLGRAEFREISIWMEQTMWAALGNRTGCGLWDERRVAVMHPQMKYQGAVAVHFSHCHRGDLPGAIRHVRDLPDYGDPVSVATQPSPACHPLALAVSQARHVGGVVKYRMLHR
jgi:hypothetical protein